MTHLGEWRGEGSDADRSVDGLLCAVNKGRTIGLVQSGRC